MNAHRKLRDQALRSALVLVVAACGGGDATDDGSDAAPREAPAAIAAPSQSVWSAPIALPLVPAAAANLPNGKVLMWSADSRLGFTMASGNTYSTLFDPATNANSERLVSETDHNMFCPGTTNLADGRLLVNGGSSSAATTLYDPVSGAWSAGTAMSIPRGYQSNTLLQDGSVLTLGGSWSGGLGGKDAESWTQAGGWRRLTGVPITPMLGPDPRGVYRGDNHLWLVPAGNGKVLHAGPSAAMNWIDPRSTGSTTPAGSRGDDGYAMNGIAVMYEAGKVLKAGGAPAYSNANASASSYLIDTNGPLSVRKLAPMSYARAFHNSVVLPNGSVLVTGGQTIPQTFSDDRAVLVPEVWNPGTETWTQLPAMSVPRTYHSVALLLPDARVLVGGGGLCGDCAVNHPDLQILTPWYLRNSDGSPATRPVITSAAGAANYGASLTVRTNAPVASFALIRLSSVTHGVNNDQRRIVPAFAPAGTNTYQLAVPTNPGVALPGYYMLFAINAAGVPSLAHTLRITGEKALALSPPGDQSSAVNAPASLALVAAGASSFGAAGLPPGLSLNTGNGVISGAPTATGSYRVTVSATGNGTTHSTDFVWTVLPAAAVGAVRYVRLEALSEVNNNPWTTIAEFNVLDANGAAVSRSGWLVSVDSQEPGREARSAIDGNPGTYWHTQWSTAAPPPPHTYTVDLGAARAVGGFRYLPRQNLSNGRIASWRFHTSGDGVNWTLAAQGSFANSTAEQTVYPLASAPANRVPTLAVVADTTSVAGQSATLALSGADPDGDTLSYSASGLPPGLAINTTSGSISGTPNTAGSYNVSAQVSDGRGGTASRAFVWTITAAAPPPAGSVRYVRLEALSEVNNNPWTTIAEFDVLDAQGALISRSGWVVSVDSYEPGREARYAIDGNPGTHWHTPWSQTSPRHPHTFTVDLGGTRAVGGFRYLPRQSLANGRIASWRFHTSADGVNWTLAASGSFTNGAAQSTVLLSP